MHNIDWYYNIAKIAFCFDAGLAIFYFIGKLVCADYYYSINKYFEQDAFCRGLPFTGWIIFLLLYSHIMCFAFYVATLINGDDSVRKGTIITISVLDTCTFMFMLLSYSLSNIHMYFKAKRGR